MYAEGLTSRSVNVVRKYHLPSCSKEAKEPIELSQRSPNGTGKLVSKETTSMSLPVGQDSHMPDCQDLSHHPTLEV